MPRIGRGRVRSLASNRRLPTVVELPEMLLDLMPVAVEGHGRHRTVHER